MDKPKHPGGRPPKYSTLEQLTEIADKYFQDTPKNEWTVTGLALALDMSREQLMDYQDKDKFAYTIKKYKMMVQQAYEEDLRKKGRSGDIFALKNFGWTDQRQVDLTSKGQSLTGLLMEIDGVSTGIREDGEE